VWARHRFEIRNDHGWLQANLYGGCSQDPASADDNPALSLHVCLPVSNIHVMPAVNLQHDDLA